MPGSPLIRRVGLVLIAGSALLLLPWSGADRDHLLASPQSTMELVDSALNVNKLILANLDRFVTPEYIAWKQNLGIFQQEHYASMLLYSSRGDGMGSFLSYLRMKLRLEFSLSHEAITFRNAQGRQVALPQDWSFPRDPWAERKGK